MACAGFASETGDTREETGGERLGLPLYKRRYFNAGELQRMVGNHGPVPHALQVRTE